MYIINEVTMKGPISLKTMAYLWLTRRKWQRSSTTIFLLFKNVGEEHDSDSNVAVDIIVHPSIAAIREECVAAQFEFNHVSVAETEFILKSLSNDPGKVDSNFFCYAATVLSPHRNVLIFT